MEFKINKKVNKAQLFEELKDQVDHLKNCKLRLIQGQEADFSLRVVSQRDMTQEEIAAIQCCLDEHCPLGDFYVSSRATEVTLPLKEAIQMAENEKTQAFDAMASVMGAMLVPVITHEVDKKLAPDIQAIKSEMQALKDFETQAHIKAEGEAVSLSTSINKVNESLAAIPRKVAEEVKKVLNSAIIEVKIKA